MRERELIEAIHEATPGVKLFRNDCGVAWTSAKRPSRRGGLMILDGARAVKYGLLPGSGDLIGWRSVEITPEMVGQTVAVFVSIEAKTENDHVRPEQLTWARNVRKAGGEARIVRERGGELFDEEF